MMKKPLTKLFAIGMGIIVGKAIVDTVAEKNEKVSNIVNEASDVSKSITSKVCDSVNSIVGRTVEFTGNLCKKLNISNIVTATLTISIINSFIKSLKR